MQVRQSYSEKLKDPRWQKMRLKILERDNFTCTLCGDKETTLHVHHEKYKGDPWEADVETLKTLCEDCHLLITMMNKWGAWEADFITKIVKIKETHTTFFYLLLADDVVMYSHCDVQNHITPSNYVRSGHLELITRLIEEGKNG